MTDNLYVEARMAMDGPIHRGEIHSATVHDRVGQTPEIGSDKLHMLDYNCQLTLVMDRSWVIIVAQTHTLSERYCSLTPHGHGHDIILR
jgi:hypothetical protein